MMDKKNEQILLPQGVSEPPVAGVRGGTVPAVSTSSSDYGLPGELTASSPGALTVASGSDPSLLSAGGGPTVLSVVTLEPRVVIKPIRIDVDDGFKFGLQSLGTASPTISQGNRLRASRECL